MKDQTNCYSILLICHSYPPVLGGSEIEAQRVCKALIARGHRVRVVCAGGPSMPTIRDWIDPEGVPVRIYAGHWNGRIKDIVFALRVAEMLVREREKYQLVYFLMQGLHLAAGLPVARMLRKPILMKISGSGVIAFMSKSAIGRLELAWLRRWARRVMILNEGMRQEAIDCGLPPDHLVWMPNPVDIEEFSPCSAEARRDLRSQLGIPQEATIMLYTGRLAPEKSLPILIDAFAMVVRQMPDALLVLVGDGPCRKELHDQVVRLDLIKKVYFTGRIQPTEVSLWLKASDIFALASPNEGFPCALAEAMSTGLASVVTDIPANRQLIKNGEEGFLVPVGSADETAEAILRIMTNHALRGQMGRLGRKCIVDNYSMNRIAERYEALFKSSTEKSQPQDTTFEKQDEAVVKGIATETLIDKPVSKV